MAPAAAVGSENKQYVPLLLPELGQVGSLYEVRAGGCQRLDQRGGIGVLPTSLVVFLLPTLCFESFSEVGVGFVWLLFLLLS